MNTEYKNEHFNLLENGLEFLKTTFVTYNQIISTRTEHCHDTVDLFHGVEVKVVDYSKLKYSVLHLSSGIELILKEKLRREDWKLLFKNINDAKLSSLYSGDFKSVYFDEIKERLKKRNVNIDSRLIVDFAEFKKERNKIEHFHYIPDIDRLELLMGRLGSEIINFIANNLFPHLFEMKEVELYRDFISELITSNLLKEDLQIPKIKEEIKREFSDKQVICCCFCFNETLVLDNTNFCFYCGMKPLNDTIIKILGPGDGGILNGFDNCPICGSKSLLGRDKEQICIDCKKVIFIEKESFPEI